jgi:hypothetical protein
MKHARIMILNQSSAAVVNEVKRRMTRLAAWMGCLILAHGALAQPSASNSRAVVYTEYAQPQAKAQALQFDQFPKWMTLDVQLRAREENQSSDKYVSGNDAVYALTRVWGGLEIRPAKHFLGYIQFTDVHALGLPLYYVAANHRDAFDDRQAFIEFYKKNVKVIAGRQELRFGSERLVGISNWTNTSRTWDGFTATFGDKNRLDLFSTSVVSIRAGSLDKHGAGLTFHGAVGTITSWVPNMVIQPFVYVRALPRVLSQQKVYGTETEVTPGAEVSGKFKNGFYFDALGALQRGSYSNDSISSGAGYVKVGYNLGKAPWKPRLTGEYDYASGNPDPSATSYRIGTFDQQYPSSHNAFGLTDLFGFQNIRQGRINLDLAPSKRLVMLIQQEWLRVASVHDSVYSGSASATVKPPTGGFLSSEIGRGFDVSGQYAPLWNNLTLNVGVGHFSPGSLMRDNKHGAPLTLAYFGLTYKFKVSSSK